MELLHQAALVPLVAMLLFGRRLGPGWWLVAGSFAVSWVGDSLAFYLGGSWVSSYAWLPIQFALAFFAFQTDPLNRLVVVTGLLLLTVTSAQISAPGPDWLLTLVASLALVAVADTVLAWPVLVYFGLGSIAYLVMLNGGAWQAYQGCRMLAFLVFVLFIFRYRRRVPP